MVGDPQIIMVKNGKIFGFVSISKQHFPMNHWDGAWISLYVPDRKRGSKLLAKRGDAGGIAVVPDDHLSNASCGGLYLYATGPGFFRSRGDLPRDYDRFF